MKINKSSIRLYASPKAVITLFLSLPGNDRIKNTVIRIENLSEYEVTDCMQKVMNDFGSRHRNIEIIFNHHFDKVEKLHGKSLQHFSNQRKLLIGAFFTKEYSIEAAALFNPSIVLHPDQSNLKQDQKRFILSLRATGEGHISSIVFRTGIVDESGNISLDKPSGYFTALQKNDEAVSDNSNYELKNSAHLPLNEKVIFPSAKAECMGMEDVRFVQFNDGDESSYYGTYTAYDGMHIKTQLIATKDFNEFKIRTLSGAAISDKGMALFPEKVNGKYVIISRQGGEKMNIMFSNDLYNWETYETLMEPKYEWELLQIGNCGSPVKTSKGWLLLTHGVGAMRKYVISAILLDLYDPTKIVGRLNKPLLEADKEEREGYVPNVVYTCGLLRYENLLLIPYAVSDSATAFAAIKLDELLNEITN